MNWINHARDDTLTLDIRKLNIKTLGESFETETEQSGPFEPDLVETSVGKWLLCILSILKI